MSALAAALVLAGAAPAPGDVPPAAGPEAPQAVAPVRDLQLQVEDLRTRRTSIHWAIPAIVAGVGLYGGWTGVEGVIVTAVLACNSCSNYETVSTGIAIGGAVVALAGLIWLAVDFYRWSKLSVEIDAVERKLLDLRAPVAAPGLAALRF